MQISSRWYIGITVLLIALAVALFGACKDGGGGEVSDKLSEDQSLSVWLDAEPDYIDPSLADFATAVTVSKNVFATLLRFDPTTGDVSPYVATDVPTADNGGVSEDGLTYTFNLRQDAVWEDGQPITADQFVYAIKRLLDPRVASYYGATYYADLIGGGGDLAYALDVDDATIEGLRDAVAVRAVDDHTLEVTLTRPSETFNLLVSLWPTAALREDVIGADIASSAWTEPGTLISSGPFRLADWSHGSELVLEAVPNFWFEELQPTLTSITFEIIDDQNTAFAAYQRGDLDAIAVSPFDLNRISNDGSLSDELQRVPLASTFAVAMNHTRSPFDTVDGRRAFCQSIDRGTLVQEVQQGMGVPTTSWLPPGLAPYYSEDRGANLEFDPSVSLELVAAPGDAANPSVEITYANVDPNGTRAEFIQGQWDTNLDASVSLNPLDPNAFGEAFGTGNFDTVIVAFGEDYHHPENWLMLWMSGGNPVGYENADYDAAALAGDWQEAERILIDEDAAVCPVFNDESVWLVKPYVKDFVMTAADGQPGDFFYWKTAILEH